MKKYLITGFSGFVSEHFLNFLNEKKENDIILGIDVRRPDFSISDYRNLSCRYEQIDMLNRSDLENLISQFKPEFVLHLASSSSVAFSWKNPVESFKNNTNIFLNLLESIRLNDFSCRILSIGSSEEYGNFELTDLPLKEVLGVKPQNPYSVARVSQELLSRVYVEGYGLDIVMTRSFNHIGPGQIETFAVAAFAKQLVELCQKGETSGKLITGDTNIVRDFVDVRDVVIAYDLLFRKGKKGEIYNVCSGCGQTLSDLIEIMSKKLDLKIQIEQDMSLVRPVDNNIIIGCNEKISENIGWKQTISIEKSLSDILDYWLNRCSEDKRRGCQ